MVAVVYWYLYLVGDTNPVTIDGDNFALHVSQMAAGEREVRGMEMGIEMGQQGSSESSAVGGYEAKGRGAATTTGVDKTV